MKWPRIAAWGLLVAMLVLCLYPLWVMVWTALTPSAQLFTQDGDGPVRYTLEHFGRVLGMHSLEATTGSGASMDLGQAVWNSVRMTFIVVAVQTLSAAMAAYAFACMHWPMQRALFALYVATMMVPGVVTFLPNFLLVRDLGLLNTLAGLCAPLCLMQGFSVFFLRQCFLSLPRDLREAALIDGAGHATVFLRIVVPLSGGPLATVALLSGINTWNEFLWPYLVAREPQQQVLTLALQTFRSQTPQGQPDWTGLMAAATLAMLPMVVLLVLLGRRVVDSVAHTAGR